MSKNRGAAPGDHAVPGRRAPVVTFRPSDGADPEAVLQAVVVEVGGDLVMATYGDGLTIEVVGLRSEQVARVLHAAQAVDPLVHADAGTLP